MLPTGGGGGFRLLFVGQLGRLASATSAPPAPPALPRTPAEPTGVRMCGRVAAVHAKDGTFDLDDGTGCVSISMRTPAWRWCSVGGPCRRPAPSQTHSDSDKLVDGDALDAAPASPVLTSSSRAGRRKGRGRKRKKSSSAVSVQPAARIAADQPQSQSQLHLPSPGALLDVAALVPLPLSTPTPAILEAVSWSEQSDPMFEPMRWLETLQAQQQVYLLATDGSGAGATDGPSDDPGLDGTSPDNTCADVVANPHGTTGRRAGCLDIEESEDQEGVLEEEEDNDDDEEEERADASIFQSQFGLSQLSQTLLDPLSRDLNEHISGDTCGHSLAELQAAFPSASESELRSALGQLVLSAHIYCDQDLYHAL